MTTRVKALLAVILGNSIFGFSFLFSKAALQMTIPSVMLAIRFTAAFLVLNLVVLLGKKIRKKDGTALIQFSMGNKPLKDVLLLALIQPVIYFIAESYGIAYTSSSFAGTIIAVIPVTGIMVDVLIMHTKVTGKQVICAFVSVAGVVLTTLGAKDMKSSGLGVCLLLIAVLAGSFFYVFSKRSAEYYNALERTYVMFGVGSAVFVLFALIQSRGAYAELILPAVTAPSFWGSIFYLAVVSSVMAFMLLNYGSAYVTVSEASIFANFTTVISIVAGVLIVHERFTLQQAVGAAMILASVYVASMGKSK